VFVGCNFGSSPSDLVLDAFLAAFCAWVPECDFAGGIEFDVDVVAVWAAGCVSVDVGTRRVDRVVPRCHDLGHLVPQGSSAPIRRGFRTMSRLVVVIRGFGLGESRLNQLGFCRSPPFFGPGFQV
jgi:hypothetical protein